MLLALSSCVVGVGVCLLLVVVAAVLPFWVIGVVGRCCALLLGMDLVRWCYCLAAKGVFVCCSLFVGWWCWLFDALCCLVFVVARGCRSLSVVYCCCLFCVLLFVVVVV